MDSKAKNSLKAVSVKSTKEQILAAYEEVLGKLSEKGVSETPEEQKKQEQQHKIVEKATAQSSEGILVDLNSLKTRAIKQVDSLSEQILQEFENLSNIREAVAIEQKHLQELYQINETTNSLSILLQAQAEQKDKFKLEMEKVREVFDEEMQKTKSAWQEEKQKFEQNYKEYKETLEKNRKREEEEYQYKLELTRRKELDEYNTKRANEEKELENTKADLLKRVAEVSEKEKNYENLKTQVDNIPSALEEALNKADEKLRLELSEKHNFELQLKDKEHEAALQLKVQSIKYLEDKIKTQEAIIKELTEKADLATKQVQAIACRALDTSAQRYTSVYTNKQEEKS